MEEFMALSDMQGSLRRIAVALEGILDRMTPAEERAKTYVVSGYVRSSNNGGNLVWLYGAHPGLQYKVATVYSEDFPDILPYIPALGTHGKIYDGEVAPSREGALKKGYMIEVPPFEVVLAPTGKRTEAGLMTYTFKSANSLAVGEPGPQAVGEPQPSPAPPEPEAPCRVTKVPAQPPAEDVGWSGLRSASLDLPAQPAKPDKPAGPVVSKGAIPDAPRPVKMEFGTMKFVPACKKLLDQIGQSHPDKIKPYQAKAGVGYDWEHVQWSCGALMIWGEDPVKVTDANWQQVLSAFEAHVLKG